MSSESYNGWRNYETWVTALWMDSEQGTLELVEEWADEELESADGDTDDAERELARRIEEMHDENVPTGDSGVFADLLSHAMGCIDWREIASHYMSEAKLRYDEAHADESEQEGEVSK